MSLTVLEPLELTTLENRESDMAFSLENQTWVRDEIAKAIGPASPSPISGIKKAALWLREWGIVGVCITAVLALIGFTISVGIFAATQHSAANSRLAADARFQAHTDDRLQSIEAKLLNLTLGQSPQKALKEMGSLQPKALAEALPALRSVSALHPDQVKSSPKELSEISGNLARVNEATPDYWPTVFQFVGFASASMNSEAPPPGRWDFVDGGTGTQISGGFYRNKSFLFKGGKTGLTNVTFENSRITIGPGTMLRIRNVRFINCVFDFQSVGAPLEPTPSVKETVRYLLNSGLRKSFIPSAG